MKTLELEKMENLSGGDGWSCAGAIAGYAAMVAGVAGLSVITAGAAAGFFAGFVIGGFSVAYSCGTAA